MGGLAETLDIGQIPAEAFDFDSDRCPLDPETLQPHLIRPVYVEARVPDDNLITYHHTRYYREDPDLGGGSTRPPERLPLEVLSGLAVRVSMGEYLVRGVHQLAHQKHVRGPWLPRDLDAKAFVTATNCAGIIPRLVKDMTRPPGKELVTVDDSEFALIADPANVGIERFRSEEPLDKARRIVGYFLLRYGTMKLSELPDVGSVVDEFLHQSTDTLEGEEKKLRLGQIVLIEALRMALDPLIPRLQDLRARGFVQPGTADPFTQIVSTMSFKPLPRVFPLLEQSLTDLLRKKAA